MISNDPPIVYVPYDAATFYPTGSAQDTIATAAALILLEEAMKRHGGENGDE